MHCNIAPFSGLQDSLLCSRKSLSGHKTAPRPWLAPERMAQCILGEPGAKGKGRAGFQERSRVARSPESRATLKHKSGGTDSLTGFDGFKLFKNWTRLCRICSNQFPASTSCLRWECCCHRSGLKTFGEMSGKGQLLAVSSQLMIHGGSSQKLKKMPEGQGKP